MTREEAKKIFGELLLFGKAPCKKEELEDLCKIVLTALEQEPILDKLKAEIDKIYEREGSSFDCLNALDELKEFIDKYKAKSEVENGNDNS